MRITSSVFLVVLAASTTAARAQFGSGIVYDPTQSAHAVQQILRQTALHNHGSNRTKCHRCLQSCAADGKSSPVPLHIVHQSRPSAVDAAHPARKYLWQFDAMDQCRLDRIRSSWSEPGGQHSTHWADHRLWFAKRSGTASHCRTRRHGRSLRFCKRQQSANNRHDPSECSPTGGGHKPA